MYMTADKKKRELRRELVVSGDNIAVQLCICMDSPRSIVASVIFDTFTRAHRSSVHPAQRYDCRFILISS